MNNYKIPTAEEFLNDSQFNGLNESEIMIEFAKLHVTHAIKSAANNAEIDDYDIHENYAPHINEKSIFNSYPLSNIK